MLGIYLVCFSLSGIYYTLDFMGYYGKYPAIMYINFPTDFIGSAVIYLYVFRLTNKDYKINLKTVFHFIPAILILMYYANYYFSALHIKQEIIERGYNYFPYDVTLFSILDTVYYVICILISAILLQRYKKQVSDFYSDYDRRNHDWIKFILIANMISAILCFFLFGTGQHIFGQLLAIISSLLIYAIGYKMIASPPILPDFTISPQLESEAKEEIQLEEQSENKYERSGLSVERSEKLAAQLKAFMEEEKPYLNPEINLKVMANSMHIAPHHLSQIINQKLEKNFYDLINAYRVEEVKSKLRDPKFNNYTLLAIGLDSGFNSKATFNSVFKKFTGMAPSEFKNEKLVSSE